MDICIFTSYFFPEDFKVNDIAFELAKRGHKITVITAVPNYPSGKYYEGYSLVHKNHEFVNDVEVIRLPVIPRGNGSGFRLALNYLSHLFFASIFSFFHSFKKKYDLVFVHQGSPVTIGVPGKIMSKRQNIPLIHWVLDLWPESVVSASNFRNKIALSILTNMVKKIYTACTTILISSEGFKSSIIEKGDFENKIVYFPNWAEAVGSGSNLETTTITPFKQFSDDDFVIMFAGNIGEAQDLETVIEAANKAREDIRIKWVIVGEGRRKKYLVDQVGKLGLNDTVFFPGRFPLYEMPNLMSYADIMLVSLKNELILNLTVPAKMQFYMSQAKPIIAMLNGAGANLIKKADCGYAIPASNAYLLSEKVKHIAKMNKKDLLKMGLNSKKYYYQHFKKVDRINQIENLFLQFSQPISHSKE